MVTKRGVAKHLDKCIQRRKSLQAAETSSRSIETLLHLRVQAGVDKNYWLDLEMNGSATLEKLDKYLRAIWLECCGHLSEFIIPSWGNARLAKTRTAAASFAPELVVRHIYDFGTTSETDIKLVAAREAKPTTKNPVALLARNKLPEAVCQECEQPAAWICIECLYEGDTTGYLCDDHVAEHPHERYGEPFRVFNSPRTGMCGYDGPATPPY
jgi:hypothetical protein